MSVFEPACVLITGAAGFIGSNFARLFSGRHTGRIILLDALTYAGNMANVADLLAREDVFFEHADVTDEVRMAEIFSRYGIDTVVHFAAESHVDRSIAGPDAFIKTNIEGTHVLLKCAKAAWSDSSRPRKFHHISTDEVYGSQDGGVPPASEESPYAPNSPYAASKAAADHLVRAYNRTYRLPVVTTNCSNNFGPFQFPEKLIPLAIVRALEGLTIPVYGDGGQIRDWLYVTDHCEAIDAVLRKGLDGETYNIAGTGELTNHEVLALICTTLDRVLRERPDLRERFPQSPVYAGGRSAALLASVPDRPGHDRRYALTSEKLQRELGVVPSVNLETGLEQTIRWYIEHEDWWRSVMDGSYRNWMTTQYSSLGAATIP